MIQPDSAAVVAFVDLHIFHVLFLEIGAAARALVVMHRTLGFLALLIELRAHLADKLGVLLGEVLVLVPARLLVCRHHP